MSARPDGWFAAVTSRRSRGLLAVAALVVVLAGAVAGIVWLGGGGRGGGVARGAPAVGSDATATAAADRPPGCSSTLPPAPPPVTLTTVTTIEQAYRCIFDHYYAGPVLDDRTLLAGAFAGLTRELEALGLDRSNATLPRLDGDRRRDWAAFAAVYRRVLAELPDRVELRQDLAGAAIDAMVATLGDNHAHWQHAVAVPGSATGRAYGLGFQTSPSLSVATTAPADATPPLVVGSVQGGPAAAAGLRPGDVIVAVNGAPPFADGVVSEGVIDELSPSYPHGATVRLMLRRPAMGRTRTVSLTAAVYAAGGTAAEPVSARLLRGDIAYVRIAAFVSGVGDAALSAISHLGGRRKLRGVILDLRGNPGGSAAEVATLLGGFVHGRAWSYSCTVRGRCAPNLVDDRVTRVDLPLVALTDRSCASACDAFSAAVKDLHLGVLVGTRTAGIVAGPATAYLLDDGSELMLPALHGLGPDHEVINGIGVAPDHYLPVTAYDLSTGRDPDLAEALRLLRR